MLGLAHRPPVLAEPAGYILSMLGPAGPSQLHLHVRATDGWGPWSQRLTQFRTQLVPPEPLGCLPWEQHPFSGEGQLGSCGPVKGSVSE